MEKRADRQQEIYCRVFFGAFAMFSWAPWRLHVYKGYLGYLR